MSQYKIRALNISAAKMRGNFPKIFIGRHLKFNVSNTYFYIQFLYFKIKKFHGL